MKKQTSDSRRNFLKKTSIGAAAIFGGGFSMVKANTSSIKPAEAEPIVRVLGKTGITLPIVSAGAIPVNNDNLAKAMLNSGMKHFDSAFVYGNGKVDEKIGELMKDYKREDFIISTKVVPDMDRETGLILENASMEKFEESFHVSLERQNTNYTDIFYLHAVSTKEAVLHEGYMKKMVEMKEQGKAKYLGVSSHLNAAEVIYAAIKAKIYDVVLIGINFLHNDLVELEKAIEAANKAGLGVVAMKVLAGMRNSKKDFNLVDKKAALKWVMRNENIHTAIMSFGTFEDLENYMEVITNTELTDDEQNALNRFKETANLFCSGCTQCQKQCPHHVEVPEYMRAYMYAYGYKDLNKSMRTLSQLNSGNALKCHECKECNVQCKSGFDIKERIADITRLRNVPADFIV
jgi:predicted aldo/keto reductase-like oxidoreductase